ncbi:hypothetical protein Tco_0505939 [Tanacetum coccineum]
MTTLAEHMIVAGADNCPHMLEKTMYTSWSSRMRLYIKGKKNGRMMHNLIDNSLLVYGTIEENYVTRPKKYEELTDAEKLQDDYDVKATTIILQGLPPEQVEVNTKFLNTLPPEWSIAVPSFLLGDDLIASLNKAMEFLTTVITSCFPTTNNQLRTSSNLRNQATIQDGRVTIQQVQGRQGVTIIKEKDIWQAVHSAKEAKELGMVQGENTASSSTRSWSGTDDLDAIDSYYDEAPCAKAVLMANLSSYDLVVISEVPILEPTQDNYILDNCVQEMYYSEQPTFDPASDIEITSDRNIISDDQYLKVTESATVQNTASTEQQNVVIMSVFEEITNRVAKAVVEQCSVDKKYFEIQNKELLENDRLLELIISQDLVHTAVNSLEVIDECESMRKRYCEEYNRNLTLEAELSKMNELSKTCSRLQNHCISLELKLQLTKKVFKITDHVAIWMLSYSEFFVINDLKAQLQAKESSISKLRAYIATLKGKNVSANNEPVNNASVIARGMFRLDLEPLSRRHKNNRKHMRITFRKLRNIRTHYVGL